MYEFRRKSFLNPVLQFVMIFCMGLSQNAFSQTMDKESPNGPVKIDKQEQRMTNKKIVERFTKLFLMGVIMTQLLIF